ncbi:protein cereblon isoform X2 [Ricinus communis]|uniref:protein cereblon isoform X2 n=1 Tax=Ricinus communis TaxID=3988 RepID=UPI00201AB643|nr:protein cereblon isoform X2 [Ricinus communis]
MDEDGMMEAERYQIAQIRELEFEELQVEEVEDDDNSSSDDELNAIGATSSGEFAFNTCLAPLHTYLGEVEDTHRRFSFLEGGAVLTLPLFYLEGVVLFPGAILPLRVIQPNFISAVERALTQVDAPHTIGVVRAYRDRDNGRLRFATIGTTAEIRQYRRLEDGSLNVVTRGQQRFRLRRRWIDVEGVPCGKVQIIQEDLPLRSPQGAFGKIKPLRTLDSRNVSDAVPSSASYTVPSNISSDAHGDDDNDSEANSEESFESELSPAERRIHQSAISSCCSHDMMDDLASSDDGKFDSQIKVTRSHLADSDSNESLHLNHEREMDKTVLATVYFTPKKQCHKGEGSKSCWKNTDLSQFRRVPTAFWPFWVYRMYDSYCLAERAADMWRQIVGAPNVDSLVKKPDLLSFYIASKIPVSESTRQELLEIDGISYRLHREIDLLKSFDLVRCKKCQVCVDDNKLRKL